MGKTGSSRLPTAESTTERSSSSSYPSILLKLRRALQRHPAVLQTQGDPPGQFTRIQADLDPRVLGASAKEGTLTIHWYAGETLDSLSEFAFHYSDSSGLDCGWHHEPNPHVDGWAHYQQRETAAEAYIYESITFASNHPVRIFWEVLDRLHNHLAKEGDSEGDDRDHQNRRGDTPYYSSTNSSY